MQGDPKVNITLPLNCQSLQCIATYVVSEAVTRFMTKSTLDLEYGILSC